MRDKLFTIFKSALISKYNVEKIVRKPYKNLIILLIIFKTNLKMLQKSFLLF